MRIKYNTFHAFEIFCVLPDSTTVTGVAIGTRIVGGIIVPSVDTATAADGGCVFGSGPTHGICLFVLLDAVLVRMPLM